MKKLFGLMTLSSLLAGSLMNIAAAMAPGDLAPDFAAKNQTGKTVHLSDYKGQFVLLYFYPKDETPGCTKEACSFRDQYATIKKMGAVVLGVSRQDAESHRQFISNHQIPFDLLVDTDGSIGKAYGIGEIANGSLHSRESVLVGRDGKVTHVYENVDPSKHTQEIIADLKTAGATLKN